MRILESPIGQVGNRILARSATTHGGSTDQFDEFERAVARAAQAEIYVDGVPAMMKVVELNLFQSLALIAHAFSGDAAAKKAALRTVGVPYTDAEIAKAEGAVTCCSLVLRAS